MPAFPDSMEDLEASEQKNNCHVVAEEEPTSSYGRRNEVYKSQITLMGLKDINHKQRNRSSVSNLESFPNYQNTMAAENNCFNIQNYSLDSSAVVDQEYDLCNLENQVAAEGHAHDAAYFSRD